MISSKKISQLQVDKKKKKQEFKKETVEEFLKRGGKIKKITTRNKTK